MDKNETLEIAKGLQRLRSHPNFDSLQMALLQEQRVIWISLLNAKTPEERAIVQGAALQWEKFWNLPQTYEKRSEKINSGGK